MFPLRSSSHPGSLKVAAKIVADAIAQVLVLPAWLLYLFGALLMSRERVFVGWSQVFSLLPGLVGVYLRRGFYRLTLRRCGAGAHISFGTVFAHPDAEVGRNVYVGMFCCLGAVTLEDDVLVASHVAIMNGNMQHGTEFVDIPMREQPGVWPRVTVGRDSWIGERVILQADVGAHCVIGAGAVVTRPIPDYAIAAGAPARTLRFREGTPMSESRLQLIAEPGL